MCELELVAFHTRKTWADHDFNETLWNCLNCPAQTSTSEDRVSHLRNEHAIDSTGHELDVACEAAKIVRPMESAGSKVPTMPSTS